MTLPAGSSTRADRQATAAAAAERRPVTVLFADVVDSTSLAERMDPEDWSGAIRQVLDIASAPVERYGGHVARLMGDGLLAIFGAPAAREDDAIRAVHAALEMVEAVAAAGPDLRRTYGRELGPDGPAIRIGVNSGLAIVEGMGDASGEIDALGDTVNVAARMQGAARPGTVLVTADTWRYASPAFDGTSVGAVQLKGKAEPVEAWEVVGRKDRPGSGRGLAGLRSPMVGRDEELQQLLGLVAAVRAGRGRSAVLLGEPGVGKSRLLAELRSATGEVGHEIRWIEARGTSYGEDVAYGVVTSLVEACFGLPPGAPAEERRQALEDRARTLLGDGWEEAWESFGHLMGLPLPEPTMERLAPLSPQALAQRYRQASDETLRAIAALGPAVIVIEDVHWADASSVEVLARLLPLAHELPVLLLLTSRAERGAKGWRLIEAAREHFGESLTEVALGPLDPAESGTLVANLLEIESLPQRLRGSILERSEGNPFFVEELIRMLIERGWVVRKGDHWVASGTIREAEVPDTLRGLLLARIDRLAGDARRIIRVASAIGRDVPVRLLATVTGDEPLTSRALGQAEAAGLVRFAAADPEPVYRFRHALIQEAAYDSLLKSDRRRLHREIGEALEAQAGEEVEERAAVLGLHFERAGDADRGVRYLHLAGRAALRRRAVREAGDLLERAAGLLDDAPETPEWDRRRVELGIDRVSASVLSDRGAGLAVLEDIRARAERLGDERLMGLVLAREAGARSFYSVGRHVERYEEAIRGALEIGERLGDPEIRALPLALHGMILIREGRRGEAIPVLSEAVDLLERFLVNEASFYAGELALALADQGETEAAVRAAQRARDLAERSADPRALADADIFSAYLLNMQGQHAEATVLAGRAADTATMIGEPFCRAMACWVAGESELAAQQPGAAITWLSEATDLARANDGEDIALVTGASLGAARVMTGEAAGVAIELDRLVQGARSGVDPMHLALVLMRRAQVRAMTDPADPGPARADVDEAIGILRAIEARPYLEQAERFAAALA